VVPQEPQELGADAACRDNLRRMLEYLPELSTLRRFADRIDWLFDTPKDYHQAGCRRGVILHDPEFRAVPELVKAMEQLDSEKFPKLMAYLKNPMSQRVRINNHVERTNRMDRFFEKVRYKWRRRTTLVRFVVFKLDEIWTKWSPPKADAVPLSRGARRRNPLACDRLQPRRVAWDCGGVQREVSRNRPFSLSPEGAQWDRARFGLESCGSRRRPRPFAPSRVERAFPDGFQVAITPRSRQVPPASRAAAR
jgi:hypothetical protein